jgi:predicted lipoprotein with Yx(FWY)xxD motif
MHNSRHPKRYRTLLAGTAVVPIVALAIAGCGGGSNSSSAASPPVNGGGGGTVDVANGNLGQILVDSQGRTLYLFKKDSGKTSACSGACATNWPPLRANGKPTAGSGATASAIGTIARSDGKPQVTYNGHPVYLFSGDQKAGDTTGQGITAFGAAWFVLSPAGQQVSTPAPAPSSGNPY